MYDPSQQQQYYQHQPSPQPQQQQQPQYGGQQYYPPQYPQQPMPPQPQPYDRHTGNQQLGSGPPREAGNPNSDRTVFIGNLPWDTTEQQLGQHCSSVGPVLHVRLATDIKTGKGKGFAFVEYKDVLTAASAVRNLHQSDFRGRSLRVDFSDASMKKEGPQGGGQGGGGMGGMGMGMGGGRDDRGGPPPRDNDYQRRQERERERERYQDREKEELRKVFSAPSQDTHMTDVARSQPSSAATATVMPLTVGSLAPTVQPSAQPYGTDLIGKLVTSLTKTQLLEILSEMKKFSASTEGRLAAEQLLFDQPQVAQTLLHILITFGLVRPTDVANIQTMQRPTPGSTAPMQLPQATASSYTTPSQPNYAPAPIGVAPTPLPPLPTPVAPQPQSTFTDQDAFMLQEIMKLSPEQIAQLPQEIQDKVRLLQQAQLAAR